MLVAVDVAVDVAVVIWQLSKFPAAYAVIASFMTYESSLLHSKNPSTVDWTVLFHEANVKVRNTSVKPAAKI